MDARDDEKRLAQENKKLAREVRRLNQDIVFLREAIEQSARTQAYIQRETDRQMFFVEQLMRTAPSILLLTDDQMSTVVTSDMFLQYNDKYDKKTLRRGVPLRDALTGVIPEPELDELMDKSRAALAGEEIKPLILHGMRDKQQRWRVTVRCMRKNDEVVGLNILFIDTTEIMDALERAEAADRAKSNFLAKMSHEIRTPINAVLGLNEMILRESSEKNTIAYAADIQNAGKTLLSIINDILDFSKVEEGKMEILPTQYELGSIINDLVNMTRSRAEKKGLEFHIFVDETTPHLLFGDEIRIRQCALNLLTNAVKYTKTGSVTLTVGYEEVDTEKIRLKFTVADTGIGIKPEDMERLTSPFARLEETRIRSIEGTGLGLAITRQLLGLMGSSLQVESIYGEGSEFSFAIEQPVVKWWPVGQFNGRYDTGEQSAAGHESFFAPEARVLVVDDMPVNLTVVKGLLKKTRIKVDTAESGAQAIVMASKRNYDVALIDHMMPEMDGIETLRALKKLPQAAETVCIALTANAISGSREKYIDAGFQDYLSKPVDSEKLEEMLMKYLPPNKVLMEAEAAPESEQKPVVFVAGGEEAFRQVEDALGEDFRVEIYRPEAEKNGMRSELPDWLYLVDGLDVEQGLRNCGTKETFLDTLTVYARTVESNADELAEYQRIGDVENEITKVHALKSTSRIIGAEALGTFAERLELAGKAGDMDRLSGELDGLLAQYRALGERLALLVGGAKPQKALPSVSDERLRQTYDKVRRLLGELEYDRAAAMLDSLTCGTLPAEEQERFEKIKRAAEDFAWDQLEALLP